MHQRMTKHINIRVYLTLLGRGRQIDLKTVVDKQTEEKLTSALEKLRKFAVVSKTCIGETWKTF